MKYRFDDLNAKYESYTSLVTCSCVFATEAVGGQPANEDGIRAYVRHHLKIEDPLEAENAVQRILHDEVQPITPEGGEIPEGSKHGLRVVRKSGEQGPWLGDWMVKACIKQAASRLYLFQQIFGSKGSFSEGSRVRAIGESLQDALHPNLIYLRNADGTGPAVTYFKEFSGRVQTPKGQLNIIYESECIAPGSRFEFEFRFVPVKGLKEDAVSDVLAMMMICGLGSNRSLECGKFHILEADIEMKKDYQSKPPKGKEAKPDEGEAGEAAVPGVLVD